MKTALGSGYGEREGEREEGEEREEREEKEGEGERGKSLFFCVVLFNHHGSVEHSE